MNISQNVAADRVWACNMQKTHVQTLLALRDLQLVLLSCPSPSPCPSPPQCIAIFLRCNLEVAHSRLRAAGGGRWAGCALIPLVCCDLENAYKNYERSRGLAKSGTGQGSGRWAGEQARFHCKFAIFVECRTVALFEGLSHCSL